MRKLLAAAAIGMAIILPATAAPKPQLKSYSPRAVVWSQKVTLRGDNLKDVTFVCFNWNEGSSVALQVVVDCFNNSGSTVDDTWIYGDIHHVAPNRHDPLRMKRTATAVTFYMQWVLPAYVWVENNDRSSNYLRIKVKS
jgi:hypothetical protein